MEPTGIKNSYPLIDEIEKALDINLYDDQIKYIIGEISSPKYDDLRGTGKTTAYCIKLALTGGEPLDLNKPYLFSDAGHSGLIAGDAIRYSKDIFLYRFMEIRERLKSYGFPVRDISNDRRKI